MHLKIGRTKLSWISISGYSVADQLPAGRWFGFLYDLCTSLFLLAVSLVGASLFAKCSLVILAILVFVYGSFLVSFMVKVCSVF